MLVSSFTSSRGASSADVSRPKIKISLTVQRGENVPLGKGFMSRAEKKSVALKKKVGVATPESLKPEVKGKLHANNKLNDLSSTEWLPETISVWTQRGLGANHADTKIEREHPAPFSFSDISRLVRFFTKKGHKVLDPFVGVGSTLKACAVEGRSGVGIELSPRYSALAKKRIQQEVSGNTDNAAMQTVITGDSRVALKKIKSNEFDFIVTSPPYWNILQKQDHKVKSERVAKNLDTNYGNSKSDLGNIKSYSNFLDELVKVFSECARVLKSGKYAAVVVSDFRDKAKYVMFHSDLAARLDEFGLELKGIKVLYQRHKRIFPYGYPYSYVPNIHHQYILIFQNRKT
jgi:DNA modification methylase